MPKKIDASLATFACGVLFVLLYGYLESGLYVPPANVPPIDVQWLKFTSLGLGLVTIFWAVIQKIESQELVPHS